MIFSLDNDTLTLFFRKNILRVRACAMAKANPVLDMVNDKPSSCFFVCTKKIS